MIYFYQKVKIISLLSGEQSVHGGTTHRHPFNQCGHCTYNRTETNELKICWFHLFEMMLWFLFRPQHYCITHTRTQTIQAETFTDWITRATCSPVLRPNWSTPTDVCFICHTAVCLEFSFSFLGDGGMFLVNWLKLAALHLTLGPPLSPTKPCVGPGGRVL